MVYFCNSSFFSVHFPTNISVALQEDSRAVVATNKMGYQSSRDKSLDNRLKNNVSWLS